MGALAAGATVATGTGAFSLANMTRPFELDNDDDDAEGFLALFPAGAELDVAGPAATTLDDTGALVPLGSVSFPNGGIVELVDISGEDQVKLDLDKNGFTGFNINSEYFYDNALGIYLRPGNELPGNIVGTWTVELTGLPAQIEVYDFANRGNASDSFTIDLTNTPTDGAGVLLGFRVTTPPVTDAPNAGSGVAGNFQVTATKTA
jgi:hypothetical protein